MKRRRQKINLLADQRELLRFVPYQSFYSRLGGGSAYRFALGDVKGIPKEWADYHAQLQSQQFQQPRWGRSRSGRCRLHRAGSLVRRRRRAAAAPPPGPPGARPRPGYGGPPAGQYGAPGAPPRPPRGGPRRRGSRGASWSTTSERAAGRTAAAVRRRDARLRRRRRGHAARRAARAGADGRRAPPPRDAPAGCGTSRGVAGNARY